MNDKKTQDICLTLILYSMIYIMFVFNIHVYCMKRPYLKDVYISHNLYSFGR